MPASDASGRLVAAAPLAEFFIVGCPRSGTTLLRWMLDAHPEIAVTPETHFGELAAKWRESIGTVGGSDAAAGAPHGRLLDDFCRSEAFRRMALDEEAVRAAAAAEPDDAWRPLQAALHQFARRRRAKLVGEKTPSHALHLAPLAKAFPDARFLCLRRDPRAVAASWRRTTWSTESPVEIAEKWRRYSLAMRAAHCALPERCLEIRYEDLIEAPESVLAGVCAFLDVPFDPRMLAYPDREREPDTASLPPDEGVDNALTFSPPDPERVDAWRRELPKPLACRIESVCGRAMSEYGYVREASLRERASSSLRVLPTIWRLRARRMLRARRADPS